MERLSFNLPTMYGDHHVLEVRRILLEITGIKEVNASSCFQIVEVRFDPVLTDAEAIKACLEEAGYFSDLVIPHEVPGTNNGKSRITRPETLYQHSDEMVTFVQVVSDDKPVQMPCPGMGVLGKVERERGEI